MIYDRSNESRVLDPKLRSLAISST